MRARYLLIWLLAQLLSLGVSAAETPLSAHFPRPAEKMAARQMVVVQIAVSALIFPGLLSDFPATLFAVAAAFPMMMLAGLLSGDSWLRLMGAETIVTAWLLTLFKWSQIPRTPLFRSLFLAMAAIFTLSGPILVYLQAEYGSATPINWNFGPIPGALAAVSGIFPWQTAIALLVLIFAAFAAQMLSRPQRSLSS